MQRSSSSIASLAAALAKAQAELVNPEKSLVATIQPDDPGAAVRSFRYAPLSSGLDIVRKTLGQHEIATIQTTAIDQGAGIINLTTVLAHSSGEWIASDWPVCAISETATPHRMGAALTYARRYALFTLVGIAGEDDLDAPDLMAPGSQRSEPERPRSDDRLDGYRHNRGPQSAVRRNGKAGSNSAMAMLGTEASAQLRDRLLAELCDLGSGDDAALWAYRCLSDKNRLTLPDAERVEEAFTARLAAVAPPSEDPATSEDPRRTVRSEQAVAAQHCSRGACDEPSLGAAAAPARSASQKSQHHAPRRRQNRVRPGEVDKSVLALPVPRRIRDRDHVRFVAQQPCLVCGRQPADAHHLRFAQSRALGRKVSDEFTVPLCRGHHREVHRCGDEPVWWLKARINPTVTARALWLETHPLSRGRPTRRSIPLGLQPPARQIGRMRRMNGGPVAAEQVARPHPSTTQFPTTSLRQIESLGYCAQLNVSSKLSTR